MIRFLLIALSILVLVAAAAILAAILQGKRAKKAEKEAKALHEAFWQVKEKAERLQKALGETAKIEEEADAERTELARTPDVDLVDRANSLFMQDNRNSKPAGNAGPVKTAGTGGAGNGTGTI
jgi:hypothetical protein